MSIRVKQIVLSAIIFLIGFVLSCIIWPLFLLRAILGGKSGIYKLFKRGKHDVCPEIARKYEHDYVRTKSGLRFHYVHTGSKDNPLMLCLHGFPECWYSWKYVLERFASDYHVVAVDMRGYGDSDKPEAVGDYHTDYLANDVHELVIALGYQKAVVVAHDWGGIVACKAAMHFPDIVDKLILMNTLYHRAYLAFVKEHPSQLLRSWYFFFFQMPLIPEWTVAYNDFKGTEKMFQGQGDMCLKNKSNFLSMEEIEIYKHYAMRYIHYGINYYRAVNPIYTGMKLKQVNHELTQPTLIIWGDNDNALDIRMIPYLKKYAKNAKSVVVEGASHWVGLDEPQQVMDAMEGFLKKE